MFPCGGTISDLRDCVCTNLDLFVPNDTLFQLLTHIIVWFKTRFFFKIYLNLFFFVTLGSKKGTAPWFVQI